MTKQELIDFCIENAGKVASGRDSRNVNELRRGRIIGFIIDQYKKPLILLENPKDVEKRDLPNPLPQIPYLMGNWYRVVSPARLGWAVKAETVMIDGEVSDQSAAPTQQQSTLTTIVQQAKQSLAAKLCHPECDNSWCHREYSGVI